MKKISPNWIWFVGLFLFALLVAGGRLLFAGADGIGMALVALLHFPVGIEIALTRNTSAEVLNHWGVVVFGFVIYAAIITFGSLRRSLALWTIFLLMLVVNVAGCHCLWHDLGTIK